MFDLSKCYSGCPCLYPYNPVCVCLGHIEITSMQIQHFFSVTFCFHILAPWWANDSKHPESCEEEKGHPAHPQVLSLSGAARHQWSCSAAERWPSTLLQEDSCLSIYYSRMATSSVSVRPCHYRDLSNVSWVWNLQNNTHASCVDLHDTEKLENKESTK